ncbi:hypothetical protein [Citreimonas sp.]|uniref:hypothetical protein n=1 Tax=Citreimonas sp. TaxID=3036715 RepID=UPI004059F564
MCLTTHALALFLSLLAEDRVATEPGRITVLAEAEDAVWVRSDRHADDRWCTMAPQLDAVARKDHD